MALFLLTPFLAQKPWILRLLAKDSDRFEIEILIKNQHRTLGVFVTFLGFTATIAISSAGLNIMAYGLIFYFAMLGLIDDLFDIHGVKKIFLFFSGVCLYFAVFDISESLEPNCHLMMDFLDRFHTFYILLEHCFLVCNYQFIQHDRRY